MNNRVIIAENKYKQKIAFLRDDHIGNVILRDGIYDQHGIYYIEKILSMLKNPIVFDIGSNIGNHALAMSKLSEMVYLFEPQKNIVNLLHKTMSLNHIQNWKIFDFGLAEQEKILPLYKNLDGNNGASTFISELKGQHFSAEQLHVYVGDDIVNKNAIPRIDFIKIDVEGFEGNVIAGLKNSIKKFMPIIIIEWNNETTKKQFKEYNLFNDVFSNYLIKAITNNHHKSL